MAAAVNPRIARRDLLLSAGALLAMPAAALSPSRLVGRVERLDPALDALIDAASPVEQVLADFQWSEGPLWVGGRNGMLLVSDPRANLIRSFSEGGGTVWKQPSGYAGTELAKYREAGSNGLALGRGGVLVADSGNRRISRIDLKTKESVSIADRFEGKRFNSPNDLVVSPRDGSVYFTDPPWGLAGVQDSPDREMDYTGVFQLAPDGTVALIGKYQMPNGIGLSPDGRTLYHTDGKIGWVAHQLDARGRSVSERPFVDLAAQGMTASGDGMKVDASGHLWASSRDGINILTPAGKRLGIIRSDETLSNCEIAADGHLYMSNNHRVARVRVKARKIRTPGVV